MSAELLERLEPRLRAIAAGFYYGGTDLEDRAQVARVAAWEAAPRWRPDGGATLEAYCLRAAQYALRDELNRARREKRGGGVLELRLDEPLDEDGLTLAELLVDERASVERAAAARAELRAVLEAVGACSRLERAAALGCAIGLEYGEVAAATGRSTKAVDNARQRAHRRVRAAIA